MACQRRAQDILVETADQVIPVRVHPLCRTLDYILHIYIYVCLKLTVRFQALLTSRLELPRLHVQPLGLQGQTCMEHVAC